MPSRGGISLRLPLIFVTEKSNTVRGIVGWRTSKIAFHWGEDTATWHGPCAGECIWRFPHMGVAVGSNPPRRVLTLHIPFEATQLIRNQAAQLYLAGNKGRQPWAAHRSHTESSKEKSLLGASGAKTHDKRMATMLVILTEKLPNSSGLTHTSSVTALITEGCQEEWEAQRHEICSFKKLPIWDMGRCPSTSQQSTSPAAEVRQALWKVSRHSWTLPELTCRAHITLCLPSFSLAQTFMPVTA